MPPISFNINLNLTSYNIGVYLWFDWLEFYLLIYLFIYLYDYQF